MIIVFGTLAIAIFRSGSATPENPNIVVMPTTPPAAPTVEASPTSAPTAPAQSTPDTVTLSAIALYGDYDEATKIGQAPEGLSCTFFGQSPDNAWAWLDCPSPTGRVWAKVAEMNISDTQRQALALTQTIYRKAAIAPPQQNVSAPVQPPAASPPVFCADRFSINGKTHQCAASQAEADALADAEINRTSTSKSRR